MISWADLATNILDLLAFFLVAPVVISEERLKLIYEKWFRLKLVMAAKHPMTTQKTWPFLILLAAIAGLLIIMVRSGESENALFVAVLFSVLFMVGLPILLIMLLQFDLSVENKGLMHQLEVVGTSLFVLAR